MERYLLGAKVLAVLRPGMPRRNLVVSLLTVGEDGYPNVCLLSPFQLVAKDRSTILIAVYEGSRTLVNLARRKSATLVVFLPPAAYYIKGTVAPVSQWRGSPDTPGNVLCSMRVKKVTRDYYGRAPITSAATFEEREVLSDYSRVYQGLTKAAH